ncbi:MAG: pyridoxal 5'-phosphate synthase glutaminase subunit PdxT [Acidobacteriota bacterium]|nr:pyridoxal 5'-phosphate synthase glutaminase subunit PdxT [Acidobacteriota bacterium]
MVVPRVGVLALQGDVREHERALNSLGVDVTRVRTREQLDEVDALVMPGGESTAIAHLLVTSELRAALVDRLSKGMPVLGTCAGLILLSREVLDGRVDQWSFEALDVSVRRNGYGRQLASFETTLRVREVGDVHGVFIRAPKIEKVGDVVEILASHDHGDGEHAVLVRQGNVWGCAFHPELTDDTRVHRLFVETI